MSGHSVVARRAIQRRRAAAPTRWSPRTRAVVMIMTGSLTAILPLTVSAPLLPPFGFAAFVVWRLLRPDLLPPWTALGFGTFDDLVSGNPLGTAIFLWTVAALVLVTAERWFLFRTWRQDWMVTGTACVLYLVALWLLGPVNGGPRGEWSMLLVPAFGSLLAAPLLIRLATGPGTASSSRRGNKHAPSLTKRSTARSRRFHLHPPFAMVHRRRCSWRARRSRWWGRMAYIAVAENETLQAHASESEPRQPDAACRRGAAGSSIAMASEIADNRADFRVDIIPERMVQNRAAQR